jgi:hypothetical protein
MMQKQKIRWLLVTGLFLISLGGLLLHYRIHPLSKLAANMIPFFAGLVSIFVLPILFLFKRTVAYAYVINGMLVIIGIITMTHFSIAHPPEHLSVGTVFTNTLFPDIAILLIVFMVGKALFELETLKAEETPARHGRAFRYPNAGWWFVHLFSMAVVYAIGHFLWR